MKVFNKIIQSDAEPSRNNIWFKDKKLWFHNNNGWEALTDEVGKPADLTGYLKEEDIGTKVAGLKRVNNKLVLDGNYISGSGYIDWGRVEDLDYNSKTISVGYSNGIINVNLSTYSLSGAKPTVVQALLNLSSTQLYNKPVATLANLQELVNGMLERDNRVTFPLHFSHIFFNTNSDTSTAAETNVPNTVYVTAPASGQYNLVTKVKYFDGYSRDINPYAYNIVQEKGLYKVVNDLSNKILNNDVLKPILGYDLQASETIYTDSPIHIRNSTKEGKTIEFHTYFFNGGRDISPTATNIVYEKGLYTELQKLKNSIIDPDTNIVPKGKLPGTEFSASTDMVTTPGSVIELSEASSDTKNIYKVHVDDLAAGGSITAAMNGLENGYYEGKYNLVTMNFLASVVSPMITSVSNRVSDVEDKTSNLVYTMDDVELSTLSTTRTVPLTDALATRMFNSSYVRFNIINKSGQHTIWTLPVTLTCTSIGPTEKIYQSPTLSVGNTDWSTMKVTVKKMTEEGSTEEHWYAIIETV